MNDVEAQIGDMARRTLIALGSRGEMTVDDLELTVDATPQLLDYALGWLAHDHRVEIVTADTGTRIRLKVN